MLAFGSAILLAFVSIGGVTEARRATPALCVTAEEFQNWFEKACHGELRIPESVSCRARCFRYVFVGGLQTSRMPGYFHQNITELRAHGVPRHAIHIMHPSSRRTVEENRAPVREELCRIACEGPERLVIIAHSVGGCDALAFALHEAPFVCERVEAVFLVQAPLGGTALADYVVGTGHAMDDQMPAGARRVATALGEMERFRMHRGPHAGIRELTRDAVRAYWDRVLEDCARAIPIVGPKLFYIESLASPDSLSPLPRATGRYLGTYYGPNDGIVAAGDQSLPELGTSLGVLDAGHADLTRRFPAARTGRQYRRALIQSILMVVGRTDAASG
jgi:pimeloyl-ACP methyl ester carboxylesterase